MLQDSAARLSSSKSREAQIQTPRCDLSATSKPVNQIVDTVGYPMDGSSHILKRLEAEDTCFGVIDLTQGYHQCTVAESSRDLLSIILPQGKYRYTCLPQGLNVSSDIFNILTDPEIRNKPGYKKNVDDVLTHAKDIRQLEERMKKLLDVCRDRNMKISPSKFQLGPSNIWRDHTGGHEGGGGLQENSLHDPD